MGKIDSIYCCICPGVDDFSSFDVVIVVLLIQNSQQKKLFPFLLETNSHFVGETAVFMLIDSPYFLCNCSAHAELWTKGPNCCPNRADTFKEKKTDWQTTWSLAVSPVLVCCQQLLFLQWLSTSSWWCWCLDLCIKVPKQLLVISTSQLVKSSSTPATGATGASGRPAKVDMLQRWLFFSVFL